MTGIRATIVTICAIILAATAVAGVLIWRSERQHDRDLERWEACANGERGTLVELRCGPQP